MPTVGILDCPEKIAALLERRSKLFPTEESRKTTLFEAAVAAGICKTVSALKSAVYRGEFTEEQETWLAYYLDFDVDHIAWRIGTIEDFDRYLRELEKSPKSVRLRAQPTLPDNRCSRLVAMTVGASQLGVDAPTPIVAEFEFSDIYDEGPAFGLRWAELRANFSTDGIVADSRLGFPRRATLSPSTTITARGGKYDPFWRIEAKNGLLRDYVSTNAVPLCELANIVGRDVVGFSLVAFPKSFDFQLSSEDAALEGGSAAKARLIERLRIAALTPDGSPEIVLSAQQIAFEIARDE